MTNNIGKKLFKKIFIWYTLIAIILTSYQIYSEYISYEKVLKHSLDSIEMSFNKSLANSVWNLDEEQIQLSIESIVALHDVIGILIIDSNGFLISKLGKIKNIEKVIFRSFKLNHNEDTIAMVTLYSSENIIFDNMKDNILLILINAFFKSFILLILVYYFSNKMITQIIHKLTESLNNISLSKKEDIPLDKLSYDNEIYSLIKSFNHMNHRLEEEIEKNKQKDLHIMQQLKTQSITEMIENIAHQWRQPLSVISTAATGIKIQKELNILDDKDEIKAIDLINNSAQILSNTIEDFRSYVNDDNDKNNFDISKSIDYSLELFSSKLNNNYIKIIRDCKSITIWGVKNELIQVIINILNNAKDVFKNTDQSNKYIFISTKSIGETIEIKIKDNAGGIPLEIINKIFDPYFSTKHQSVGTGLGLYMSNKILKDHMNGYISVKNENYEYDNKQYIGACFTITLKKT